jgi:anaerobic ribonucleoside-triphosphate reductase
MNYMKGQEELNKLNAEYEKAKSEDLLDEAIVIRNKIKNIKDLISNIASDPTIIDSWNGKSPSNHKTLQQIHEDIIDRVGTKLVIISS